jgi:hypothetical protein
MNLGSQPREMLVLVPPLDDDNVPTPYRAKDQQDGYASSLTDHIL